MRVEVGIPGATSQTPMARYLRDSIMAAFSVEDQTVDAWYEVSARGYAKAELDLFTTVMVTVLLAPVGGTIWDAEKATLRRVLAAVKRVMAEHGVGAIAYLERPDRDPVDYWIPSGPEGDLALGALNADYDADPPGGVREWWPEIGWMTEVEWIRRTEAGESVAKPDPGTAGSVTDEEWVEFWMQAGERKRAEVQALIRASEASQKPDKRRVPKKR